MISSEGRDYILHDNQWLSLMSQEGYGQYVKNYNHPKGGRPLTREGLATISYDRGLVQKAGFLGATIGGGAGVTSTILEWKINITPVSVFVGLMWGQIDAYSSMMDRMKQHDEAVEYIRNNKK